MIDKRIKKIITYVFTTLIIVAMIGFLILPLISYGATDKYTVLAPLPGTTAGNCTQGSIDAACQTTLDKYLPGLFNLLIGFSAAIAVFMLIYWGFTYITAEAIGAKGSARTGINNAILGLVFVIGAWLILNTINPNLTQGLKLDISTVNIPSRVSGGGTLTLGAFTSAQSVTDSVAKTCQPPQCIVNTSLSYSLNDRDLASLSCPTCTVMTNIPFGGNTNKNISSGLYSKLSGLNQDLQSNGTSWQVTEAWPPVISHDDPCHDAGACVDAKLSYPTPNSINTFVIDAQKNGLNPTYEVKSDADRDTLRAELIKINPNFPVNLITTNTQATAPHFHVK